MNKDGIVEDVTLQKGRAIKKDGSMFSGVMKTVNGKGQEVAIEYNEGFMTQSSINGELFKKFENIDGLTRNQGVQITQFNPIGREKSKTLITNYDNGKVKRIHKVPDLGKNSDATAIEFTKDGKIAAKAQYENTNILKQAHIFDENGKVIRELEKNDKSGCYFEKIYDKNGTLRIKKSGGSVYPQETPANKKTFMLSENKLYDADIISLYDANGKIDKSVHKDNHNFMQVYDRKNSKNSQLVFSLDEYNEAGASSSEYFDCLDLYGRGDCWDFTIRPNESKLKLNYSKENISPSELKSQVLRSADEIEEVNSILQRENSPYISNHCDLPNLIKQMRESVSNIVSE